MTEKKDGKEQSQRKKKRIKRNYFKIDASPEEVAQVVMNTKPKQRGEWDFEKRD